MKRFHCTRDKSKFDVNIQLIVLECNENVLKHLGCVCNLLGCFSLQVCTFSDVESHAQHSILLSIWPYTVFFFFGFFLFLFDKNESKRRREKNQYNSPLRRIISLETEEHSVPSVESAFPLFIANGGCQEWSFSRVFEIPPFQYLAYVSAHHKKVTDTKFLKIPWEG